MAWRAGVWGAAVLVGLLGPLGEAGLGLPGAVVLAQSGEDLQDHQTNNQQAVEYSSYELKQKANNFLEQGIGEYFEGDLEKAVIILESAIELFDELKDQKGRQETLLHLGRAHRALGDRNKFLEYSELSLEIARKLEDKKAELELLISIGSTYRREHLIRWRENKGPAYG